MCPELWATVTSLFVMITLEVRESTDAVDDANPLILPIVIVPSIFKVL